LKENQKSALMNQLSNKAVERKTLSSPLLMVARQTPRILYADNLSKLMVWKSNFSLRRTTQRSSVILCSVYFLAGE